MRSFGFKLRATRKKQLFGEGSWVVEFNWDGVGGRNLSSRQNYVKLLSEKTQRKVSVNCSILLRFRSPTLRLLHDLMFVVMLKGWNFLLMVFPSLSLDLLADCAFEFFFFFFFHQSKKKDETKGREMNIRMLVNDINWYLQIELNPPRRPSGWELFAARWIDTESE